MGLTTRLVERAWAGRGAIGWLVRALLIPLSWGYALGRWVHGWWRRTRPPFHGRLPVILVGNLTVGGTGKTPLVADLARRLAAAGWTPGVVSRGYRGVRPRGAVLVSAGGRIFQPAAAIGDEPWMLARDLAGVGPVAVGTDRVAAAGLAVEQGATALVLDDGFQQRARFPGALRIVAVNAADAFGNGALLPAGSLREPPHALAEADVVVLTHADAPEPAAVAALVGRTAALAPRALTARVAYRIDGLDPMDGGPALPAAWLEGRRIVALSGLGYPQGFERTLTRAGAAAVTPVRGDDHHRWTPDELERAAALARREGCDAVVTTAKDAARIAAAPGGVPWLVVRAGLAWLEGGEAYAARVARYLDGFRP